MASVIPLDLKDLSVLNGKWYEISKIPMFFTSGLYGVMCTYAFNSKSDFTVRNDAHKGSFDGANSGITAKLWVPDNDVSGKCQAQFVWPLWAEYWFIELGKFDDSEILVTSNSDASILHILCRKPTLSDDTYKKILDVLQKKHKIPKTKIEKLEMTPQQG